MVQRAGEPFSLDALHLHPALATKLFLESSGMPSCSHSLAKEQAPVEACLVQPQAEEGSRECVFTWGCKALGHDCLSISNLEVWQ